MKLDNGDDLWAMQGELAGHYVRTDPEMRRQRRLIDRAKERDEEPNWEWSSTSGSELSTAPTW